MTAGVALLAVLLQAAAARPTPLPTAAPTAVPSSGSKLSGGFGQKPAASGKTRVVVTDSTLAPSAKGGTFSVAGKPVAPHAGTPAPGTGVAVAPDDETRWRGRAVSLRASLATAENDLARAEAANPVVYAGRGGYMVEVGASARNAALSPYRVRLMQLRGELAGLPEECRQTQGCQPGWVR